MMGMAGDALRDKAEPEVADRLAGVPFGCLMRLGRLEARRGVAALCSDVVRMDPQEDPRVPGPGQAGQLGRQALAQALASFAGIDDEPRKLHLCLGVIDPQLAVGDKPLIAVQPELLYPVLSGLCADLLSRHWCARMAAPHDHFLVCHGPAADRAGRASGKGIQTQSHRCALLRLIADQHPTSAGVRTCRLSRDRSC